VQRPRLTIFGLLRTSAGLAGTNFLKSTETALSVSIPTAPFFLKVRYITLLRIQLNANILAIVARPWSDSGTVNLEYTEEFLNAETPGWEHFSEPPTDLNPEPSPSPWLMEKLT
jgi:hypothetical protein